MRLFRHKKSPYWQCSFYNHRGELKKRSTRCTDKKAATSRALGFERDACNPHTARVARTTLEEVLTSFIGERTEQARVGKKSEDTVDFYTRKAGQLLRYFEHQGDGWKPRTPFYVAGLSASDVDDYVSFRRKECKHPRSKEKVSESTISKELVTLRAALKLARRRGIWTGDVEAVMPIGFSPEYKPKTRFLPTEELQRLLPQLTPDRAARLAYIVGSSACWRETELAQRDDLKEASVLLRGTKTRTRYREVPIVVPFQKTCLDFAAKHAEGEKQMLFVPWPNVRRDLLAACERAKIAPCSPNDLRRTFATWMRQAGVPLELIPPMMGHRDGKMVERVYGRLRVEDLASRIRSAICPPELSDRSVSNVSNGEDLEGGTKQNAPRPESSGAGQEVCPGTELNRRHGDFQSPGLLLPNPSDAPHLAKYKRRTPPIVRQPKAKTTPGGDS